MTRSTINLAGQGVILAESYAKTITKVRISRDAEFDPEFPWCLDGYNEDTRELSEDVSRYNSHAEAVAAIPAWLHENAYEIDRDFCYECNRVTNWNGEHCDGCGRQWGHSL